MFVTNSPPTATDTAGKWRKYESDAFGNVTKTIEPNPAGGANFETTFSYNMVGKRTQLQMTRGAVTQTRSWTYNYGVQLASETHPESGTTTYGYNSAGLPLNKGLDHSRYGLFTDPLIRHYGHRVFTKKEGVDFVDQPPFNLKPPLGFVIFQGNILWLLVVKSTNPLLVFSAGEVRTQRFRRAAATGFGNLSFG